MTKDENMNSDMHSMNMDMSSMDHGQMDDEMDMGGGHMMHMGNFKQKFWLSLIVAIPIFILSPFMGIQLPFQFTFTGSDWLVLILASFLFFYGGQPFLSGAKGELQEKSPAMMTLISMGISVAYIYSLYAFIANHFINPNGHVMDFFWELASLIVIMLLGHWIEMNAVMNAGNAMEKMAALLPGMVHVVDADGHTKDVALHDLTEGQTVLVQAGEKIPADGDVVKGSSSVNESLVTGEAKAITKENGDQVIGGSVNGNGTISVKVTGTGENGYLAQVMKLVSEAQQEQSKAEGIADKVSKALFYAALSVGIVAFFVWLAISGPTTALERMVTVLVIACPHALGVAIPLVVARSTSIAATNGLLIRDRHAIETAKRVDTVLMDKTGTLTEGVFKVNEVQAVQNGLSDQQVLQIFASLETGSSHPLATGILTAAKEQDVKLSDAQSVQTVQGVGLNGEVDGTAYSIVTADYLEKQQLEFDRAKFEALAAQGNSVSYLISDQKVLGLIAQGDQIKPEAKAFIAALNGMNIQPVMLTGDNEPAAKQVASQLGNITVKANLKPEDKEKIVRQYQDDGHQVMMVGDGINDAPSLARANIGVAIGAGTDVAIDSADVILVKSNPKDILNFLNLARATNRKMNQNLWWGAGYNIIAIPLAAGVLAGIGIILSPAVGALIMSLSTIIVAINAMTLKMRAPTGNVGV
ncbi:copper-transporting P-type ATPase [Paucilactobacillus hokkaidonensis JCM 18461]|uniref:P-type Cu(+) transporter n=2 Tax=Paucilactobacillus hokkaidonensis TaxID=1193095 RepID=A0A0A1GUR8_9LACO|nr:heavy metal translocating P-type ATPase [Paucilactobacillus hokkaidonensis]BAP84774.1 copper-transporting P-type ATPase [Paucilactobacillus hokkaidonensis JCM 18461]